MITHTPPKASIPKRTNIAK